MESARKYLMALMCLLFAFMLASCTLRERGESDGGVASGGTTQPDSARDSSLAQSGVQPARSSVKQQQIARMQQALAHYEQIAGQGGWPRLSADSTLEPGAPYGDLADLRKRLVMTGDMQQSAAQGLDSAYSGQLVDAVKHFQMRTGLEADGIIGPATWSALNTPPENRVDQIRASLGRLKELPDTLGTDRFILVNIPEFRLRAYRNGKPVLEMPVIVGEEYHEKQTPRFSDTLEYVIFRPYWNVPDDIAAKEILPEARRDHSYLDQNEYEIVSNWGPDARVYPVTSENLDRVESGSYKIRQKPGHENALGLVKFMFPNENAIYLHGTPADHLFERASRGYSHGCIRVERPEALAEYVLKSQPEWTPAKIEQAMNDGDWQRVNLNQTIPVHIVYLTAFVDPDGTVHFADDIYHLMSDTPNQAVSSR